MKSPSTEKSNTGALQYGILSFYTFKLLVYRVKIARNTNACMSALWAYLLHNLTRSLRFYRASYASTVLAVIVCLSV